MPDELLTIEQFDDKIGQTFALDEADTPALQGWRRDAFGEDALRLKRGELALVLDGARVRVVPVRRAAKAAS